MKINTARQKMLRGEPAFGYAAKLGSPGAAEFLTHSGVDFVSIDTQHGSWGMDSIVPSIIAICSGPAIPMARVAFNNYTLMGQLLDAGDMHELSHRIGRSALQRTTLYGRPPAFHQRIEIGDVNRASTRLQGVG